MADDVEKAQFCSAKTGYKANTIRTTLAVVLVCLALLSTTNLRQYMKNDNRALGRSFVNAGLAQEKVLAKLRTSTATERTANHAVAIPTLQGQCENLLDNITNGKWVEDPQVRHSYLREVTGIQNHFQTGNQTRAPVLWREDGKCGSKNDQNNRILKWGPTSAWCDPDSTNPCCSNDIDGVCGNECDCDRCVDIRKTLHAEAAIWATRDRRCQLKRYGRAGACDVAKRFTEIYFAGDSFVRKMSRAFLLTLTSRPYIKLRQSIGFNCETTIGQFYFARCRLTNGSLAEQLVDNPRLCGAGHLKVFHLFPNRTSGLRIDWESRSAQTKMKDYFNRFHTVVRTLAGKRGSVIVLSSGIFFNCNATDVLSRIKPAVDFLKDMYNVTTLKQHNGDIVWPHIIYATPDMPGLLKRSEFLPRQNRDACGSFVDEVKRYLDENGIPVLDFRQLTTGVYSFDGTHYGLGVNMMKVQILLNYLDTVHR